GRQTGTGFAVSIKAQEMIDLGVDKAHQHPGWQPCRRGGGQQVSHDRAVIPEAVAIGAYPILPRTAPKDGATDQRPWGGGNRWVAGGPRQRPPIVALAEATQGKVSR